MDTGGGRLIPQRFFLFVCIIRQIAGTREVIYANCTCTHIPIKPICMYDVLILVCNQPATKANFKKV